MEEWKQYKLSDICDLIAGFAFKSVDFGTEGVSVIKIKDIQPPFVNLDDADKVNLSAYDTAKLKKFLISKGDFLLAMTGATIGKIGKYISNEQSYLNQRVLKFQPKEQVDSKFVYYSLLANAFQLYILNHIDSDSAQPNISANTIGKYELSIPCIETQKRIVDILSSLDSKIELNRRINDNLEQQAQALFKAWFVDNPNPNWREATLSKVALFIGGYSYNGEELTENSNVAMATIKNFGRNGGFKVDGFKDITPSGKLKECHYANMFDILVAHTDLTQNADVIGNAELLLTKGNYDRIIFSMDLVKVLPNKSFPYKFLLAAMLKNKIFKGHCLGYVNGTTVLHLSKKALPEFEIKIPFESEANMMNDTLASLYKRMAEVLQENDRLTRLRDTLLPKLMSGELKINDLNC